jgi:hypothetical protein
MVEWVILNIDVEPLNSLQRHVCFLVHSPLSTRRLWGSRYTRIKFIIRFWAWDGAIMYYDSVLMVIMQGLLLGPFMRSAAWLDQPYSTCLLAYAQLGQGIISISKVRMTSTNATLELAHAACRSRINPLIMGCLIGFKGFQYCGGAYGFVVHWLPGNSSPQNRP